jgi:hypothetical protein
VRWSRQWNSASISQRRGALGGRLRTRSKGGEEGDALGNLGGGRRAREEKMGCGDGRRLLKGVR